MKPNMAFFSSQLMYDSAAYFAWQLIRGAVRAKMISWESSAQRCLFLLTYQDSKLNLSQKLLCLKNFSLYCLIPGQMKQKHGVCSQGLRITNLTSNTPRFCGVISAAPAQWPLLPFPFFSILSHFLDVFLPLSHPDPTQDCIFWLSNCFPKHKTLCYLSHVSSLTLLLVSLPF